MKVKHGFGDRLRSARLLKSLTQGELAEKVGVTLASVSQWELGTNIPRPARVKIIADYLGVDIEWLYSGVERNDNGQESLLEVPPLIDGCGPKYFPKAQLESQGLDLESLYWLAAPDDSMSPSVREGDVLIVDVSDREVKDGKVYVIRYGESLIIKRLFKRINGLLLRSDNTAAVPDETIPPNKQDAIEVVGRVVLRIGEL